MRTTKIADRIVGDGAPTWIVIELGVTHGQDVDLAKRMIAASKAAGADAVKVECIDPDALVAREYRSTLDYSHRTASGASITENYYQLLQRVSMTRDEISVLSKAAQEVGIPFFGTAFDLGTVDFLAEIKSCAIKISSGEISHIPLIQHAAKSGLQVILDTGRSSIADITRAVYAAQQAGCATPVVMHNPSGYPAAPQDVNLGSIPRLKSALGVPVGFSCHSRGYDMALGAVAFGCDVVEKPVSQDNTIEEDEHVFSVNLHELGDYVARIRGLERAIEFDWARFFPQEDRERKRFRQSIVAVRPIKAGELITRDAVDFTRPGWGIEPEAIDLILGRRAAVTIDDGCLIQWSQLT
jgi:N,N'-diacetyllegionaminate synthase